jgi:hypothetical protein
MARANKYRNIIILIILLFFLYVLYKYVNRSEGFNGEAQQRVHLVLYSDGEPFDTTKRLTIDSVNEFTNREVIIHDYNLEKIKQKEWFTLIKDLPSIHKPGRRDGYYCAYKAFCPYEVYNSMNDNDILYYVDSSQYYRTGFTENIDKLCDIVNEKGFIAGSVGDDVKNNSFGCCDNIKVWNKIIPNNDNEKYLNDRHVLASWFILRKTEKNTAFMNEWVKWCVYKDDELTEPLITYHHPGDQSIFNILVRKYNLPVFYSKDVMHNENKNKNTVLNIINNTTTPDKFFIYL